MDAFFHGIYSAYLVGNVIFLETFPMNKKDLIDAVFQGQELPRVPVGFWFHFLENAETEDATKNTSMLQDSLEGHRAFIQGFDPDMVKVMSDGFFFYPSEGPLERAKDLSTAIPALEERHPFINLQVELLGDVMAVDKANSYFYNIFSPLTTLRFLVGYPKLISFLKEDPAEVASALSRIGKSLGLIAKSANKLGSGIYLSVQNPDINSFTDAFYREYISPSDKMLLEAASPGRRILHICGYAGVRNNVEFFQDYEAEAFNWAVNVEGVSLMEGRRIFFGKVLIGGFANTKDSLIYKGSKEDIEAYTRNLITEAKPKSLIIGADCTVPGDINLDRLRWVREALGKY
jgi:uroporphyrinogen decarboxylase